MASMIHRSAAFALLFAATAGAAGAQGAGAGDTTRVRPITPPVSPLPPENQTANITKFSFIAYGDTRGEFDGTLINTAHMSVVNSMLRQIGLRAGTDSAIKFVVQSGDMVVDGRRGAQINASYVPVIERITVEANTPYFLAVGNHDVFNSPLLTDSSRVRGLRNTVAANQHLWPAEGSPRRLKGYPTYAVAYGNTFFILYDSQIAGDSVQYEWVKSQLEGLDKRRFVNIVAVCHHPTYSSGPHGAPGVEMSTAIIREKYMPLFRKHHVKLLVTGHEHFFEHRVERYVDAQGRPYRMDQIVTGGGGAPLYSYQGEPAGLAQYVQQYASERVRVSALAKPSVEPGGNPFHYVIVHVDGPNIRLEIVAPFWGAGFSPYRSSQVTITP
jgi:hypothetical protein